MELKPGYKQTEVGVIPEDWVEGVVEDYIGFKGGSQPDKSTFKPQSGVGRIRLIQIRDYKTDKYITYIPKVLARRFCSRDDIMIGRYGPPVFQILRGIEGAYNVALIKAIPNDLIVKSYAYYFLKNDQLFKFIDKLSRRSSGQTGVDLDELKGYPLPLPPTLAEQEAIAEALSDADALIESLEQLIAKKRQIKQGAMQELLRPKDDWVEVTMLEVLKLPATYGIVKAGTFRSNGVKMVRGGDIRNGRINSDLPFVSDEKNEEYKRTILKQDDVVIALVGYPGASAVIPQHLIGSNISRAVGLLRYQKIASPRFMASFLNSPTGRSMILAPSAGSAQQVVNLAALNKLTFQLPPFKEQTRIATILSDMDAEITALESKLAKARQVKQGMMQELLTGRIRLT